LTAHAVTHCRLFTAVVSTLCAFSLFGWQQQTTTIEQTTGMTVMVLTTFVDGKLHLLILPTDAKLSLAAAI